MTRTVLAAGRRFHVYDAGSGPVLFLVHGFPLDHTMWREQFEAFPNWRVVAPDLRGFGQSEVVPGTSSMADLADDCQALLTSLAVHEPVVFCGLSMGGYVAWQFARRHPEQVRALVLCDTRAVADSPEATAGRLKMADHVLNHGTSAVAEAMLPKLFAPDTAQRAPQLVAEIRRVIEEAPPEGVAAAQRGMAERPDVSDWLPGIRLPALLIVGEHDVISPPDEMQSIAAAIPGSRCQVIAGAGHMAPLEQPAAVNQALSEFLNSLP